MSMLINKMDACGYVSAVYGMHLTLQTLRYGLTNSKPSFNTKVVPRLESQMSIKDCVEWFVVRHCYEVMSTCQRLQPRITGQCHP
jgi:hypothetical protein